MSISTKAERHELEEFETFIPIRRRARITNIDEFRSRDHKRRVPRDLAWQLGGAA